MSTQVNVVTPATSADYDSGWIKDDNNNDHREIFKHGLGVLPGRISLYFSVDQKVAYVATSGTRSEMGFNPEGLSCDETDVTMWIARGANLFNTVDFDSGKWVGHTTGFWRVLAWK